MKKKSSKKTLLAYTEKYAIQLLSEATGGKLGKAGPQDAADGMQFSDKRSLLDSLTRLLAIKHRIDPEQEESEFMSMKEELHGTSRTLKNRAGESPGLSDDDDDRDDEPDSADDLI